MTPEQYKIEIQRTWCADMAQDLQICHAALGIVGEVGETEAHHEFDEQRIRGEWFEMNFCRASAIIRSHGGLIYDSDFFGEVPA